MRLLVWHNNCKQHAVVIPGLVYQDPFACRGFVQKILVILPLLLSACADYKAAVTNVSEDFKTNVYQASDGIKRWWHTPPYTPGKQSVATSYCYRAYQDVMCYRQPMPGWEHRLVGYQGTDANEPPAPMMQPLAEHYPGVVTTAQRAASAEPVFIGLPPEIKADASQTVGPASMKPLLPTETQEALPNPSTARQF